MQPLPGMQGHVPELKEAPGFCAIGTVEGKTFDRRRASKGLSSTRINPILTPLHMIINVVAVRFGFPTPWLGIKSLKVPRTDIEPFALVSMLHRLP